MNYTVTTNDGIVKVGTKIRIIRLDDPYDNSYAGRTGQITLIDDMNQLHGTWGGLAIQPERDIIKIID